MEEVISMPKHPCSFCRKKEATQLCDFVVDYAHTTMLNNRGRMTGKFHITCDNQLCKDCAVVIAGFEFCPSCHKLYEEVKQKHDRRKGRLLIDGLGGY